VSNSLKSKNNFTTTDSWIIMSHMKAEILNTTPTTTPNPA